MIGFSQKEDPMKSGQYTAEQIIKILDQAQKGEKTV